MDVPARVIVVSPEDLAALVRDAVREALAEQTKAPDPGEFIDCAGAATLRRVRFALVDLPMAALRRDVETGTPPSGDVQRLLLHTCAYVLRHTMRGQPNRRVRR